MSLVPYAFIFFVIYGVGYPLYVYVLLVLNKTNRELAMEDQLVRAQQLPNTREDNPNCYEFRKRYAKLYYQFKPDYYYWGLVTLARKFAFAVCELMLRSNAAFQLCSVQLIMFAAYVAQVRCHPYMSTSEFPGVCKHFEKEIAEMDGEKERKAQAQQMLASSSSRRGTVGPGADAKRKKVRMGRSASVLRDDLMHGKISAETMTAAASSYLWNWNQVEANLLMACVLISVFGVMFETEYVQPGTYWYEALGNLVLALIIISLVYYMIVFWSEVMVKLCPASCQDRCLGCNLCTRPGAARKKIEGLSEVELQDAYGATENPLAGAGGANSIEMTGMNPMSMSMMGPNAMRMADGSVDASGGHIKKAAELNDLVRRQQRELEELKKKIATDNNAEPEKVR